MNPLVAVACKPALVLPAHEFNRQTLQETADLVLGPGHRHLNRVKRIIDNSGIERRYLVQSLVDTITPNGFGTRNDVFIAASKELGERAALEAMQNAGVVAPDVDLIITTSCTGFMIPSLCAHLIPKMGFKRTTKRLPITERGCAAGAFALGLAREHIAGGGKNVLIVAHEFCSLTYQRQDLSMQALVGALLFGDGVAACVVRGVEADKAPTGLELQASQSWLFEDSWGYMGFEVKDSGLHLVLDKGIPGAVERSIKPVMLGFLDTHGLAGKDVDFHVLHPGGKKVIDEVARTFELAPGALDACRDCLRDVGNLSSASVMVVLKNTFERAQPKDGARGLLTAFGPGFSAEMVLGRWRA
ncbi:MAG: 3-oxoacyl-[acyl-carrier-protein] synthase III C-terminal domain-containing protein [Deltaproteobacteria bacterium]|nr:3-oxoacyl-[acyl-carrier-protein] synthase III C-terminal domain-containing protein [Deltaproteobacteria bacterium]